MKLNVLLALLKQKETDFKNCVSNFNSQFSGKQGLFQGEKRTYVPYEGTIDDPSKRGVKLVQSTVTEKLDWLKENHKEYIDFLLTQEATNASGTAKAQLIVEGENWGTFSSLELLRLKSILENPSLHTLYDNVPVRSDKDIWEKCDQEEYEGRDIMQTPKTTEVVRTTEKESFIMTDVNLTGKTDLKGYVPQVAQKTTMVALGDYTRQLFSGELSQYKKAMILKRKSTLLSAVIAALHEANNVEKVNSSLSGEKVFSYLHG